MSNKLYTKTIEEILKEQGFSWDDYLFLLNNEDDVYEKIDLLNIVENYYEETSYEPIVIYDKNDILNATFLSSLQIDFLRKNNMINEDNFVESYISDYKELPFKNKTLWHYYRLYYLLRDLCDKYKLKEQFGYDNENYMMFFKTNLKNIKITYTRGFYTRFEIEKYEII